jgi:hypothetical protein
MEVMKQSLTDYKRVGKVALGSDLKIIFANTHTLDDRKVLDLNNVAGYFDKYNANETLSWLRVDSGDGPYGDDLAMRLRRPEIAAFQEIFLFTDKECVNFSFRAVAESVIFRDWSDDDKWLK